MATIIVPERIKILSNEDDIRDEWIRAIGGVTWFFECLTGELGGRVLDDDRVIAAIEEKARSGAVLNFKSKHTIRANAAGRHRILDFRRDSCSRPELASSIFLVAYQGERIASYPHLWLVDNGESVMVEGHHDDTSVPRMHVRYSRSSANLQAVALCERLARFVRSAKAFPPDDMEVAGHLSDYTISEAKKAPSSSDAPFSKEYGSEDTPESVLSSLPRDDKRWADVLQRVFDELDEALINAGV